MAVDIVYETHALTTDNEAGMATGWLPGQLSPYGRQCARELGERRRGDGLHAIFRWALDHLLRGLPLADLVSAPFDWRPGWSYTLPDGWDSQRPRPARAQPGQSAPGRG